MENTNSDEIFGGRVTHLPSNQHYILRNEQLSILLFCVKVLNNRIKNPNERI